MPNKKPPSLPPSPNGPNGDLNPRQAKPAPKARSKAPDADSETVSAARGTRGRFAQGNTGGPGNPFAKAVGQLRSALMTAVTKADIEAIIAGMVKEAKAGNVAAAREVLDRCLGKPVEADLLVRLEELEAAVATQQAREGSRP
jgi:hypothetical protein